MSKSGYNDIVSHPIPEYLLKRVQSAAAGFVLRRYANKLGWLPINERSQHTNYYLWTI